MVYKFFGKKFAVSGIKTEIIQNQQLAEELHKPIIRKFKKRKRDTSFKAIYGVAHLVDMHFINNLIKELDFCYMLLNIFRTCARVIPLNDKNDVTIVNAFQDILNGSKRKPNKIRLAKGS